MSAGRVHPQEDKTQAECATCPWTFQTTVPGVAAHQLMEHNAKEHPMGTETTPADHHVTIEDGKDSPGPVSSTFIERRLPRLSKKQSVLDYGYRTGEGSDEDFAVFELPNEDIPTARSSVLYLAHADFEALGSPEVITVTIEPGDLLNDDSDSTTTCPSCGRDHIPDEYEGTLHDTCVECLDGHGDDQ